MIPEKRVKKYRKEINEAGVKWHDAKQKGDNEVKMAQSTILFKYLLMQSDCEIDSEIEKEAINEFWIRDFNIFDPGIKSFCAFYESRIDYRKKDVISKNTLRTKKRYDPSDDSSFVKSYNESISVDDDETILLDILSNNEVTPEDKAIQKRDLEKLIILISGIWSNLHGKADNERKRLYYKLFTTDVLAGFIKSEYKERDVLYNRERDILNGMYNQFLDYFMEEQCRSLDEIFKGKIKQYITDEINNREIEVRNLPIKNPVYVSYLANIEQIRVRDSAVSEQHKGYKELIKKLLQKQKG